MDSDQTTAFLAPTVPKAVGTALLTILAALLWTMRNLYTMDSGRAYPFPGDVTWTVVSVLLLWPVTLAEYLLIHTALGGYLHSLAVVVNIAYLYILSAALIHSIRRYRS